MGQASKISNQENGLLPDGADVTEDETRPLLNGNQSHRDHGSDVLDLSGIDNPHNPKNMPTWRKWSCACMLGAMTFAGTFSSSVFNAAIPVTAREFDVSLERMSLATSLFVFGFATGPVVMGPTSELLGRKIPFFLGYLAFILFQIPVALAQDARSVLVFRFLGGVASAASPAIVGGYLADFLAPIERGVAIAVFAATTLIGPEIGAIAGAVLVQSDLGWRWTAWTSLILGAVFSVVGFFILPETYLPVLEQRHAARLRRDERRWALHSRMDESPVSFKDFAVRYLTRPMAMLCQEPILALMTLYVSFVFGLVYLLFVVSLRQPLDLKQNVDKLVQGLPDKLRPAARLFTHCRNSTATCNLRGYCLGRFLCLKLHVHDTAGEGERERQIGA